MIKFLILFLFATTTFAGSVSWVPPTERVDGTPLPPAEISGFRVYYSNGTSGVYPNNIWIPVPGVSAQIPASTGFNRHVVVTTVDTESRESDYSFEVVISGLPVAKPKHPSNITVDQDPAIGLGGSL